jgi:hypothetical protein
VKRKLIAGFEWLMATMVLPMTAAYNDVTGVICSYPLLLLLLLLLLPFMVCCFAFGLLIRLCTWNWRVDEGSLSLDPLDDEEEGECYEA